MPSRITIAPDDAIIDLSKDEVVIKIPEKEEPAVVPDASETPVSQPPKKNTTDLRKKLKGRKEVLVFAVVAVVVIAALTFPLAFDRPPRARIDVFDYNTLTGGEEVPIFEVTDGQVLTISARRSDDDHGIEEIEWTLPDDFSIMSGTIGSSEITGYFKCMNLSPVERVIGLKVIDTNGGEDTKSLRISVRPFQVSVLDEKIGDKGEWKISGSVNVFNNDGIGSFQTGRFLKERVTIVKIYIEYDGTLITQVLPETNAEDGFMIDHPVYLRNSHYAIDIEKSKSEVWTDDQMKGAISGSFDVWRNTYIYAPANRTVNITTDVDGWLRVEAEFFKIGKFEQNYKGRLIAFPFLNVTDSAIHISHIAASLNAESHGDLLEGGRVIWYVEGIEPLLYNKRYVPTFVVSLLLDENLKNDLGISGEPDIKYWIADNHSHPMKHTLSAVSISEDGTQTTIHYTVDLTDEVRGFFDLPGKTSSFIYSRRARYFELDEWEHEGGTKYLPPLGNKYGFSENGYKFYQPEDAVDQARNDPSKMGSDFDQYLKDHGFAYVVAGYYNKTDKELWNLTFGEGSSSDFFNVVVEKQGGIDDRSIGLISREDPLGTDRKEIPPVMNFSNAAEIFYEHPLIRHYLFSDNKFNFRNGSFGLVIQMRYASLNLESGIQTATYSYIAMSHDLKYQAILDAGTGQIMYVLNNRGDGDISFLLGWLMT